MRHNNNLEAFFALLRAGLWEKEVRLLPYGKIDFAEVERLAEEQSVMGLVAAGFDHVTDMKPPKRDVYPFIGRAVQLEKRNADMNEFIGAIVQQMREAGIYTVLVKGQGVAQCYERPLWRASGDIDLFFDEENFLKAREFIKPLAVPGFDLMEWKKNISATIPPWEIELHANQNCGLSKRMDAVIREVQNNIFEKDGVRCWHHDATEVFLPSADNHVIIIFTHFLKHFYKGGLGLRQICDWTRLLWTSRCELNVQLLEKRLKEMGLMSEWRAFGAFAVNWLGMPSETMPLFSTNSKWKWKAKKIMAFVIEVGNFGHNREDGSRANQSFFVRKSVSLSRRIVDTINHFMIFPLDSMRFFPTIVINGLRSATKGIG